MNHREEFTITELKEYNLYQYSKYLSLYSQISIKLDHVKETLYNSRGPLSKLKINQNADIWKPVPIGIPTKIPSYLRLRIHCKIAGRKILKSRGIL